MSNRTWSETLFYVAIATAVIIIFIAVLYTFHPISNATTPVRLHHPTPGVTCASMVTEDGVAVSCWKE